MGIIFFGNERLASSVQETGVILQSLLDNGYVITHLVINQGNQSGRKKHRDVVLDIAERHKIEIISSWDEEQLIELAKQSELAVLAAFGRIIKPAVIEAFKYGIVNIHPSLLPELRGPTPIETAILSGQKYTGVSLMALAEGMDNGNIYDVAMVELTGSESKQELYNSLSMLGAKMLIENLPNIINGTNIGKVQDEAGVTFSKKIDKSDGIIDWNQPAKTIEQQIRAYTGWPGSQSVVGGKDVTITGAETLDETGDPGTIFSRDQKIIINCSVGSLQINKFKPNGKNEMTSQAFLAGNKL